ncbi:MAG: prolyl oligopeptidase family serine peptidase [Steroidobacteraceae bacterium]
MSLIEYPATRRTRDVDERAGVQFPDPYRWLEESTDEVRRWQQQQSELAADSVRRWPHFESLKRWVAHFSVARAALPRRVGNRWFRISASEGATQARVIVAESPGAEGRVLFDPVSENAHSPPFVSWISPSPDARTLALGVCADGSENNTVRLIDVATGERLEGAPNQVLMDAWLGGVHWLKDSSGFYYTALTGSTHDFRQAIFFHRMGTAPPTQPVPIPIPGDSRDYRGVMVSRCGRWAAAVHRILTPTPVALLDLTHPNGEWRPFVTDVAGVVAGHVLGDRYIAMTDVEAPRGRVVAIPLDSATPNDPASWQVIVPESEAVIRGLTPVANRLYVNELVDTYARVRVFDGDGSPLGEAPLPGKGAIAELPFPIMNLFSKVHDDAFVFGYSSLTQSAGIYRHRPGEERLETLIEPEVRIENAVIEDRWVTSADGTRVPYHTVRLDSVAPQRPQPTLIYAYGSGGVPLNPQFPGGAAAAFVTAGGVFVQGHLRGGGEFGRNWWRDGVLKNRQNSYADLYAIAEDLIARGATAPRLLGVTGGSAGGLMSGVAITQRPDLWRVAIPRMPILDLIGSARTPYGLYVGALNYGDLNDAKEVRRVAGFSPYQLVTDGTVYPAVYIDAGDTDPRCPPWHARKFAARLQAAQAGEAPILLHVWEKVGHGWATARDVQIEESTEWLAFAMQCLGLIPPPPGPESPLRRPTGA